MFKNHIAIDSASDGKSCIRQVQALLTQKKLAYDAVFLDNLMPSLSGVQTAQQLSAMFKQHQCTTKIFLTTGQNLSASFSKQVSADLGIDDVLPKPISVQLLENLFTQHF